LIVFPQPRHISYTLFGCGYLTYVIPEKRRAQ